MGGLINWLLLVPGISAVLNHSLHVGTTYFAPHVRVLCVLLHWNYFYYQVNLRLVISS